MSKLATEGDTGPHFDEQYAESLLNKGSWTSGLFDCFQDIPTCALSFCCPCVRMYVNYHRLGPVPTGSISMDGVKYLVLFIILVLVSSVVSFLPPHFCTNRNESGQCTAYYSPARNIFDIILLLITSMLLLGMVHKMQVREEAGMVCLKAWCCHCCFLAQISRHIDALMGHDVPKEGRTTRGLQKINRSFEVGPAVGVHQQPDAPPQYAQPSPQQQLAQQLNSQQRLAQKPHVQQTYVQQRYARQPYVQYAAQPQQQALLQQPMYYTQPQLTGPTSPQRYSPYSPVPNTR